MTISQTPFLPDLKSDDAIPQVRLAYLQERTRNQLFQFILKKYIEAEAGGLTKAKLARRIHRSPEVITRLLGSPGNWTISTISDLLAGIADEELVPNSVKILWKKTCDKKTQDINIREIAMAVSAITGVGMDKIRGAHRDWRTSTARQIVMYLRYDMTGRSHVETGRWLGGRDHTTVLHGCRMTARRMAEDADFAELVERCRRQAARQSRLPSAQDVRGILA